MIKLLPGGKVMTKSLLPPSFRPIKVVRALKAKKDVGRMGYENLSIL